MTAIEIINKWCDSADKSNKFVHKDIFWKARDILENDLKVPEVIKKEVYEFIQNDCKVSNEQKKILAELEKMM